MPKNPQEQINPLEYCKRAGTIDFKLPKPYNFRCHKDPLPTPPARSPQCDGCVTRKGKEEDERMEKFSGELTDTIVLNKVLKDISDSVKIAETLGRKEETKGAVGASSEPDGETIDD